jgi:TM2 domain-containing membrane protein YozV
VVLTFLLGFFGLDHFYLRSNETAMKKFLMNVCGLGFWYIWDILQVLQEGKRIRKDGLNSPFDWIRGIGRGTFKPLPVDIKEGAKKGGEYAAPKSYIIYTLLAVCVGFLGMDKFYLGESWKGFAKLFSTLNIFLFLFGLFWVIWDAFHAIFMTESIMKEGITVPMPFNFFFSKPTDASALFKVQPVVEKEQDAGLLTSLLGFIPTPASLYKEFAVPLLQPTVGTVIGTATKLAAAGTAAASLVPSLPGIVGQSLVPDTLQTIQGLAQSQQAQQTQQTGGGSEGPGPILAGALTALILAGGLKGVSDFLAKRHG